MSEIAHLKDIFRMANQLTGGNVFPGPNTVYSENLANGIKVSSLLRPNDKDGVVVVPPVDVYDTEDSFIIVASLAGASPKTVQADFDPNSRSLILSGTTNSTLDLDSDDKFREKYLVVSERSSGQFQRKITLPQNAAVDENSITASFKNGVVKVVIKKVTAADSAKKISINVSSDGSL
ncbi:hypothetical protein TRVA0_021S00100 [Trichomonascus vanleenenianus]|uniref:Hsp20/alpha crystallin family protein n=1 Tax=Trichomonascus vanleenenianus TaxID=2268995 RepID=UPI003ECA0FD8